jgi:iron complex transport system substrate-binding protein
MRSLALLVARTLITSVAFLPFVLHAEEITVHHAQGETRVPANPKTVATLDIASLDTLAAIGVDVAGVPRVHFPEYLAKFDDARYRKMGSLFEPDYEAFNALTPGLVIVGGRSARKFAELSKIAPTIDLSPDMKRRVESGIEHAELLGQIFHKEPEVSERVRKLRQSIAALRSKTATAGIGLLIMTTGGRISKLGPGSWFGTLYDDFGVRPPQDKVDNGPHGQVISSEFILQVNPDWLFVIDRDAAIGQAGASARQLLDNDLVRQTKAWKADHVVYLDPVNWYIVGDGLTALQAMVDQVDNALSSPK